MARMRMLAIALAAGAALLPQPVAACVVAIAPEEPPPANAAERRALRQRMAEHRRFLARQAIATYHAATSLVELVVVEVPDWRRPIRMRVTAVYKGDFTPGQEIAFPQELPNSCGGLFRPTLHPGMRGFMHLRETETPPYYQFNGFLSDDTVRTLRQNRILPRPRR
ncbi:MAG TPA: hypothetical protein VEC11_17785 [Allosphingosinicella sp.]|nr:hypothetical protein [Allosphingosinicella sp.]